MYLKNKNSFLSISILILILFSLSILSIPVVHSESILLLDGENGVKANIHYLDQTCGFKDVLGTIEIDFDMYTNEPVDLYVIVAETIDSQNGVSWKNGFAVKFSSDGIISFCASNCTTISSFRWILNRNVSISITYFYGILFILYDNNTYSFPAGMYLQIDLSTEKKFNVYIAGFTDSSTSKTIILSARVQSSPTPKPLNQRIIEAITGFFQSVANAIAGFFQFIVGGVSALINALKTLAEFIGNALMFLKDSLVAIGNAFRAVADFFRTLFGFFGNWGDPEKYNAFVIQSISDQRIRDALTQCPDYHDKALCDEIAGIRPEGILGYIHYFVWGIGKAWNYILIGLRYIIYLWFGIMVFILANGVATSLKTGSIDPVMKALEIDWKIMTAPFKLLYRFIEFVVKLVQAIAEFIQSIKPV